MLRKLGKNNHIKRIKYIDMEKLDMMQKDKIRGSLIGGAVGDALGYPIEFINSYEGIKKRYGDNGITRLDITQWWLPDDENSGKAWISDDTQMTLFTACGLLNAKRRAQLPSMLFARHILNGITHKLVRDLVVIRIAGLAMCLNSTIVVLQAKHVLLPCRIFLEVKTHTTIVKVVAASCVQLLWHSMVLCGETRPKVSLLKDVSPT